MAYRLKINKRFKIESEKTYQYISEEWGFDIADKFIEKVYSKIYKLIATPLTGAPTRKYKSVRKLMITRHNTIYYRVKGETVTILSLFDTRQHPKKNKYK